MAHVATKLAPLRSRLGELRRRRQMVRLATGVAGMAAAALGATWLAFLVDFFFEMGRLERLISLALVGLALWIGWRKLLQPYLGQQESDLDVALLVESRMKIDSDLVAALQFEDPEARSWGSGVLRGAVVDYVADFSNSIDVFQGHTAAELRRRAVLLAIAGGLWVPFVMLYPRHLPVFVQRLFLSSMHYPTQTRITELRINGFLIKPGVVRMRHGRPLEFVLKTTSPAPAETGEVRLKPRLKEDAGVLSVVMSGLSDWAFAGSAPVVDTSASVLPLKRTASADGTSTYVGQSAPLTEPLEFQIFVGDAWTDSQPVDIVPLPVISLELKPTPPDYARNLKIPPSQAGSQVLSVVEGSRVDLAVTCTNKGLRKATVTIGKGTYPLKPTDDHRNRWTLDPANTPFAKVTAPFTFAVQVEDLDEQKLERPLAGHVRLLTDREPRVMAAVVTERVLPMARPTIGYKATDDFGLAEVKLHRQVERADGGMEPESVITVVKVDTPDQPVTLLPQANEGLRVDLTPLKLEKGDKVRITVEVTDYRGTASDGTAVPGKSATSEPLVFQVTDQSGILEGLTEADQKSARQLDGIIQRQLGIGEAR